MTNPIKTSQPISNHKVMENIKCKLNNNFYEVLMFDVDILEFLSAYFVDFRNAYIFRSF